MFNDKTARDRDTARFLLESQRGFYEETYKFLRGLGFKGVITASNWATASPQIFGPLEKYSYTATDFIDRHGYFDCNHKGEAAEWSLREGHTYSDRSALRFDAEQPGKPKLFVHAVMDPHYDNKPSMCSETTFCRPNRYRSEAPLFYAAYGALQGSDCIVHFALDGANWGVKPGFFMQPWTVMTPAMMGQFPAAAMIYRKGLVSEGKLLVELNLKLDDLLDLRGTPLPQDAEFDELRLKDVPGGKAVGPDSVIDPLVHFAGRANVNFTPQGGPHRLDDLSPYIDRRAKRVASSTGQLKLDYGRGVLVIDAPAAQGISGAPRGGRNPIGRSDDLVRSAVGTHRGRQSRRPGVGNFPPHPAPGHVGGKGHELPNRAGRRRRQTDHQHRPGPLAGQGTVGHGEVPPTRCGRVERVSVGPQRLPRQSVRTCRRDRAGSDNALLSHSAVSIRSLSPLPPGEGEGRIGG